MQSIVICRSHEFTLFPEGLGHRFFEACSPANRYQHWSPRERSRAPNGFRIHANRRKFVRSWRLQRQASLIKKLMIDFFSGWFFKETCFLEQLFLFLFQWNVLDFTHFEYSVQSHDHLKIFENLLYFLEIRITADVGFNLSFLLKYLCSFKFKYTKLE